MQEEDPDIICLQETKAFHHQCPPELRILPQNNMYRHAGQRPGYAGTAILSKFAMVDHTNEFDHSHKFYEDGRITEVELPDNILLLSIYFPNGGTRADGTEMLTYKLSFYDELTAYVQQKQQAGYELILTGDFNICHTEIDIARPKENAKTI
jgi:exodeoxyribonuclease-3